MDKIDLFLKDLSQKQLKELKSILEKLIDGDIDYFIFRIKEYLKSWK